jgi:hypothetical protein
LKFTEPKTKNGKPLLGVTVSYNPNNRIHSRWFINGDNVSLEKLASVLEYKNKNQLNNAMKRHGMFKVMTKGLDKLRSENA